jgi:uncharacterized protein (TIGR00725 family)
VRAVRLFLELMRGFRALHFVGPCVTVFGSARFTEDHLYYRLARETGAELAKVGFTVMTGGGPGIMEAANRGAKEMGGRSIGCNIELPLEQKPNPYLDQWITFRHFVRKVMLVKYSAVLAGRVGHTDELRDSDLNSNRQDSTPFRMGRNLASPLDFMRRRMVIEHTIDRAVSSGLSLSTRQKRLVSLAAGKRFSRKLWPTDEAITLGNDAVLATASWRVLSTLLGWF